MPPSPARSASTLTSPGPTRPPCPPRSTPPARPARPAYHWAKAHAPVRALPATIQAGLQSQAAYAFADAQQHFETALELWDQVPDAAEHATLSRVSVLRHAAESAFTAGDPVRAIALTRAAL